jgi:hypothetical protein
VAERERGFGRCLVDVLRGSCIGSARVWLGPGWLARSSPGTGLAME